MFSFNFMSMFLIHRKINPDLIVAGLNKKCPVSASHRSCIHDAE